MVANEQTAPTAVQLVAQAHVQRGQALMQADRAEGALAEARLACMFDPCNAACRVLQGMALLRLEDAERAERHLGRACQDFPQESQLWGLFAEASWKLARHEAALIAIDRAWALAPSPQLAARKARMLLARGDLTGAEALLNEAIARFSDQRPCYSVLVDVHMAANRWAEAASVAERACAEVPTDFEMRHNWAVCLLAAGRLREAIAAIDGAVGDLAAAPEAIACRLLLRKGEAHRQLGDVEAAIDAIVKALSLRPDDEMALHQLSHLRPALARPYRARFFANPGKTAACASVRWSGGTMGTRARPSSGIE
jgi:predicted Zn-dependent protease